MSRKTNQELCDAFRSLLTDGARDMAHDVAFAVSHTDNPTDDMVLTASKKWRGFLWADFAEIERRLCPAPAVALADAVKLVSEAIKEENNGS